MKVLAGIVLYNPELDRLEENIINIYNQVDKLILIDNGSNNINEVKEIIINKYKRIKLICNNANLGIAYALNQILNYAIRYNYEWFLTLDQDSVASSNLISEYLKFVGKKNVALITCKINDRNYGALHELKSEYEEVNSCITSGTLNNTTAISKVGGFDSKMFIDMVDFDICASLIENNYKIIRINYDGLLHEVGKTTTVNIFGKSEKVFNHNPFRTYYIIRNHIYIIKKHKSLNTMRERLRFVKRILIILLFQKDRLKHLKSIILGIKDSRKMFKKNVD